MISCGGGIIGPKPGGRYPVTGISDCDRKCGCGSLWSGRPRDAPERGVLGGQEGCRVECNVFGVCVGLRLA